MEKLQILETNTPENLFSEKRFYSLCLLNDNTTPVNFVVEMLKFCMYYTDEDAEKVVRYTEKKGKCEVKRFTDENLALFCKEQCEKYVNNKNLTYSFPQEFKMEIERTV